MHRDGDGGGHPRPPEAAPHPGPAGPEGPTDDVRPGHRLETWAFLGAALVGVLALFSIRCAYGPQTHPVYASRSLSPEPQAVLLPPPPMDDEYFPCSDCHEDEPIDRTVRELEDEHDDLQLAHGETWCFDCHSGDERDRLHLANGRLVPYEESWRLCTQCHGSKLAEWRAGVHGKRTGHWWGPKEYQNCVACHDPHSPGFKELEPEPPPRRPEALSSMASTDGGGPHEEP